MRKLTILGPVKRVLPARVARYDRKWSISGSKTLPIKRKSSNRKVHFWQGISLFHYSSRPVLPFDIKPCLKAFFLITFKCMSNKMSPFLLLVAICINQEPDCLYSETLSWRVSTDKNVVLVDSQGRIDSISNTTTE